MEAAMSACYKCKTADPEVMQFAYEVQFDGATAELCEACFHAEADELRQCGECMAWALLGCDDIVYWDCCREWICTTCGEDHADTHIDVYTYHGVSRKDFF
jgi:hypothetical protein